MSVRIAIPEASSDAEYNARSMALYLDALRAAGSEAVEIDLALPQAAVARILAGTQAVLLPGSRFDVEPERYGASREPQCGPADAARTAVDELLLQDAFNLGKPVLAICHGAQSLNVWRGGTLIQDLKTGVQHRAGREVLEAHAVTIAEGSRLGALLGAAAATQMVNSTHHQAILQAGDQLSIVAVSPEDGVVEAVELDATDHFVLGVQWHPERTYHQNPFSRAIFSAFVGAADCWPGRTGSMQGTGQ
jgi:putative glutamine amidotransferase